LPPLPRKAGRGMTEYVLRTGRPALADLHEIHRLKETGEYFQSGHPSAIWLGVPLTIEGRTFGVMTVQDQDNPTAFGAEEKRILEFVAGQTALAIERKRREEELQASTQLLQESEERFGKAFHFTPAPLSILRLADARLLEVNAVFLEVFGYTRSEVLERTLEELALWKDPEQGSEFLRVVRRQGFVHSFEVRLQTKERGEDIELMSAHTIELNGEPCFLMLNVVVTERKRAEEELVRALAHERELSELKGRFVSLVSHEFRTPLGIIMSSAEILDAYLDRMSAAERQENVNDILQSTRHMVSLMEKVLLLGRSEAGRLTCNPMATSLDAACRRLVEEVASTTHHRCPIHLFLPEDHAEAVLDESILRHIFTNLTVRSGSALDSWSLYPSFCPRRRPPPSSRNSPP